MTILLNGRSRSFRELNAGVALSALVKALELKADRIAIEVDGTIAARGSWTKVEVREGARVEIVHFVGGGCDPPEQRGTAER